MIARIAAAANRLVACLDRSQPWWDQFQLDQESGSMGSVDGRLVVIYFFSRK